MPKYSCTERNGVSDSGFVISSSELVLDQSPRTLLMRYCTDGWTSLEWDTGCELLMAYTDSSKVLTVWPSWANWEVWGSVCRGLWWCWFLL